MPSPITHITGYLYALEIAFAAGVKVVFMEPTVAAFLQKAELARQKFPERVELVDDLPRTASGKVQKNVLRERIAATLASPLQGEEEKRTCFKSAVSKT